MFKRFWWVFLVMLPVGAIGGLLVAAVVTYVMPKKYESETIIEVKPVQSRSNDGSVTPPTTPQYFYGTEFEKIKSRTCLAEVVDRLDFTNRWGVDQETAIRVLRGIVSSENIRGTDLIAIRVRHTDRKDARDITAELARYYRNYRMEILHRDRDRGLAELNKAVMEQEEKLEERRKILAAHIRNDGPHTHFAQDYIDAKRDFETDQQLLQTLKLKQIGENITAKMLGENVIIHEEPQVPQSPVSPNVTLNLILGAVAGFLLSPLLALPVIMLLNRLNPVRVDGPPVLP